MTLQAFVDRAADLVEPPTTWQHAMRRLAIFFGAAFFTLWVGDALGFKMTAGFIFGEAWGGLLVYGAMRKR